MIKTVEAQLNPTLGSEIQRTRPCVVISPDDMNVRLRTVIVAPMTSGSRPAGFRIALTFQGKQGLIPLDQIRTLDRARLVKRLGALRSVTLAATPQTLQAMFAPLSVDADSLSGRVAEPAFAPGAGLKRLGRSQLESAIQSAHGERHLTGGAYQPARLNRALNCLAPTTVQTACSGFHSAQ